ncbi:hypothetical protein NL676_022683 [Syzygium grande]|nr:hypothetical protein NL676_022683 [Syzygium grande]
MAVSSSAWMLSAKGIAVSTAILSVALAPKLSVLSIYKLVKVHISLLWLEPLFNFLIINGVIFAIAAFSKLQKKKISIPIRFKTIVAKSASKSFPVPEYSPTSHLPCVATMDAQNQSIGATGEIICFEFRFSLLASTMVIVRIRV